jgi:hypothetical protein
MIEDTRQSRQRPLTAQLLTAHFSLFPKEIPMQYDHDKVDEMALALLYLTTFQEQGAVRAWKGMAWEVMDRLYEKGYISDPKNKNKSVYLTEEGQKLSEELFWRYFSK